MQSLLSTRSSSSFPGLVFATALRGCTHGRQVRIEETIEAIKAVGAGHSILGIDLGQTSNPSHADTSDVRHRPVGAGDYEVVSSANDEWIVPLLGPEAEDALPG
jgi:hypothetical protein